MRTVPLRVRVRAFVLEIPRDDIAHTMHQTRGIFVLGVPLFLATEHFSFGIELDIAGVLRSHGK